MLVRCPQCQYANQVEADATKPRIVCARCATVISVEFLSNPSVPPAFESPVSEVPVADVWAGERPPSEPSFMKTPESPLDLDSLLDTPAEAAPTPPLVPPPPVLQATSAVLASPAESRWDADEILDIPRAATVGEAQPDPLAVEDLLAATPLTAPTHSEYAEPLLAEAEPVLDSDTSDVWGAPLSEAGENAAPQTASYDENQPAQYTNGDYAEPAPEVQPEPVRPSVFAQDSYTRSPGSTFVMATPDGGSKGRLAKVFLFAALFFMLLLVAYVGLSGFVKDWFARRNQQVAVTPGATEANTSGTTPSVAPSLGAKTDASGKKASPSASASVAASAKPSASPSATATPAATNQNAASKPTPTPPQTGTSGHAVGSGDGSLTIQIGSYKTVGEAQARVAKLKAAGVDSRVVKAEVPGKGTWYRVHSGRFTSEAEASKHANELRAKGATRDFIVTGYQNE